MVYLVKRIGLDTLRDFSKFWRFDILEVNDIRIVNATGVPMRNETDWEKFGDKF